MIDYIENAERSSPSFPPLLTPLSKDWGVFFCVFLDKHKQTSHLTQRTSTKNVCLR